jgi:hypothetical protein
LIEGTKDSFYIYSSGISNGTPNYVYNLIGLYSAGTLTQYDSSYFVN